MQFFPCVKITGANSINSISKPPDKKSSLMDVFYKIWAWNKPTMHRAISIFMNILYGRWQKPFQANQSPTNQNFPANTQLFNLVITKPFNPIFHISAYPNFTRKSPNYNFTYKGTQIHIYRFSQPKCPSIFKAHLKDF